MLLIQFPLRQFLKKHSGYIMQFKEIKVFFLRKTVTVALTVHIQKSDQMEVVLLHTFSCLHNYSEFQNFYLL